MARALVRGLALALGLAATGALPAMAEGPDEAWPASGRPALTILRPVGIGDLEHRLDETAPGATECIVTVGGLGSHPSDGAFDQVLARYREDGRFRIHRFGMEGTGGFAYDTAGSVSRNAAGLTALVRSLDTVCSAIHLVAYSMGGTVADRAFSMGLSAADGVVTYLPLAAPHNGSSTARVVSAVVSADEAFADLAGALAQRAGLVDPRSEAVSDLARATSPRPVRDISALRLRLATDPVVLRRDHQDRRWRSREYLPGTWSGLEGHGGILTDPRVRATVESAIAERTVAQDGRGPVHRAAASVTGRELDSWISSAVLVAGAVGTAAALVYGGVAGVIETASAVAAHFALGP